MTPQIEPCPTCPWRKSTRTRDIPGGGMDHARARRVRDGIEVDGDGRVRLPVVMACHCRATACAGFVVRDGFEGVGLRLAIALGLLDPDDYGDGGVDLYDSFDAMMAAHPPADCA